jgi:hypothetical protein
MPPAERTRTKRLKRQASEDEPSSSAASSSAALVKPQIPDEVTHVHSDEEAPTPISHAYVIESPRLCDDCVEKTAAVRCEECDQLLCTSCEEKLHRKGSRAFHERKPVEILQASSLFSPR